MKEGKLEKNALMSDKWDSNQPFALCRKKTFFPIFSVDTNFWFK